MPEYRTYGGLDDRIAKDGDYGFIGFNNRIRPDQLQKGTLADAQSIRLDRNGEAQVRKGIELIEAPFAVGGEVLRLPTSEEIGTDVTLLPTTIRRAELVANVMELFLDPLTEQGHEFAVGENITVEGLAFTAPQSDPNGTFVVTDVVYGPINQKVKFDLTGIDTTYRGPVVLPIDLNFNLTLARGSAIAGNNMIFDIGQVTEVYASTAFSDPNSNSSESIIIASNVKAVAKDLESNAVTDIYYPLGETVPPLSDMIQAFNKVFIFRDGNTALEWDGIYTELPADELVTDRSYSITDLGDTTQAQWNTIAGTTGVTYEVNDSITVDAEGTGTGKARSAFTLVKSGVYTQPVQIDCVPGEFAITNSIASVSGSHDVKVGDDITVMSASISGATGADSGLTIGQDYVVNKVFTLGSAITTITGGVAPTGPEGPGDFEGLYKYTLTTAIAHNLVSGEPIIMDEWIDDGTNKGTFFNRSFFVQGVPSSTTFTIYAEFDTTISPATYEDARVAINGGFQFVLDSRTVTTHVNDGASLMADPIFTKRVSVGLGFTHMPAPPYATYHQRRLVMPFKYSVDEIKGQYTYRKILDEVIISDILDSDTYDEIYSQYRFNAGTADYTVGLHSFSDNSLLVFNRNSIHTVQNTVNLQGSVAKLLTNEVGCVARKSIIQVGNQVIFLSDNGVYGTQFLDEYNLRGTETPMSESINETINRINKDHWEESRAVYFDNRYYIAVPLDDAQRNNAILIFNFLNSQWESIDMVDNVDWDIENLIVAGSGLARGVYAINQLGGIHRLDTRLDGRDRVVTAIGQPDTTYGVPASITTRQYTMGTMDRKRFNQFELHVESSSTNTSDFDMSAETENPDANIPLAPLSSYVDGDSLDAGEDISIRSRLGNYRGYGIQFTINNTQGRPRIRAIETNGSISFRSTKSAE